MLATVQKTTAAFSTVFVLESCPSVRTMYYIGLDIHRRTISYCVKDGGGMIHAEGKTPATRFDLDGWMKTFPQPWTAAMEATVFTEWIYDHHLPLSTDVSPVLL